MHAALVFASSLLSLSFVLGFGPQGVDLGTAASTTAPAADSAFVKVKIERAGKVTEHPGYRIDHGVEEIFAIQEGGKKHEISVLIRGPQEDKFDVAVGYSVQGRSQGQADLALEVGKYADFEVKGTKVSVYLDPQGDTDKSRKDKIEKPKRGAPLD